MKLTFNYKNKNFEITLERLNILATEVGEGPYHTFDLEDGILQEILIDEIFYTEDSPFWDVAPEFEITEFVDCCKID